MTNLSPGPSRPVVLAGRAVVLETLLTGAGHYDDYRVLDRDGRDVTIAVLGSIAGADRDLIARTVAELRAELAHTRGNG